MDKQQHALWGFVLLLTASIEAATIDDFETYASSGALAGEWVPVVGGPSVTLETGEVFEGSQAMRMSGGFSPIPIQVLRYTFAEPQDWSTATFARIKYKGLASNAVVDIEIQLLSSASQEIVDQVASRQSVATGWQDLTLSLSGQAGLDDVAAVQIAVGPGFPGDTTTMFFDDFVVEFPSASPDVTVTESGGSTQVTEGGATDSVSVSIASQPTQNVVVTPIFDSEQVLVTPASRTITPANWESAVTFTCSAFDDDDIEGEHSSAFSFSLASGDPSYGGLNSESVQVTLFENDFLIAPTIANYQYDGTDITLTVFTEANQHYMIQESSSLMEDEWTTRAGPITGLIGRIDLALPANESKKFFRVLTVPSP